MPHSGSGLSTDVETSRLHLRAMDSHFLTLCLRAEQEAAAAYLACQLPSCWFAQWRLMALKLRDLRFDPDALPWCLRAMIHKQSNQLVGHIGFHSSPRPAHLLVESGQGMELGYEVYEAWRRQGLAHEALQAMLCFAKKQGVQRFVLSIAPGNTASTRLAHSFGFTRFGEQYDDVDGLEYQYQLPASQLTHLDC